MSGTYDIQQVCENGHQINNRVEEHPEHNQDFCDMCGAKTITKCMHCETEIRGYYNFSNIIGGVDVDVPSHCFNCGKAYHWTENKIVTAIQIFAEFDLTEDEEKTIEQDINNIAKDIPQARLSAMRLKPICQRCGKVAYDVLMEFASKTTAEILKN